MTVEAHIYSLETGEFTGRTLRGPADWCMREVDVGFALHFGEIDWRRNRVDLETGALVSRVPVRPADTGDTFYTWDEGADDWIAAPTVARLDRQARANRDALFSACDWTQCRDIPEATALKWQPYRQALRDITDQEGYPHNIIWPTPPSSP
jgi:hypothetical protein